jgi:hypothetical protein
MSGTATTQLGNGMTHPPVWSASMIELVAVVTARLHDHPRLGRDEGMPPAPDIRAAHPLARSRTEARLTVPTRRRPCAPTGKGKKAPPEGTGPEP